MRFIVAGAQRSGTTALHTAILSHPHVTGMHGEALAEPLAKGVLNYTGVDKGGSRIPEIFDAITRLDTTATHNGMKFAFGPSGAKAMLKIASELDAKIILIRRHDLTAQVESREHRRVTGIAHSWGNDVQVRKIRIAPHVAISHMATISAVYETLRGLDALHVRYEDFLAHPEQEIARVFAYLDRPPCPEAKPTAQKITPPPEEYISNCAQIRRIQHDFESGCITRWRLATAKARMRLGHVF